MGLRKLLIILFLPGILFFACHPERDYIEDTDAHLTFTLDTLYFDTVFTTIGTITKSFRVKNIYNRFIKIQEISLAGGSSSVFRINVDGTPGLRFTNLEIAPRDSMFIFVEATLDPNNSGDILRIQDSIVFLTNGNLQDIDLVAWGQDVHIIREGLINENTTWSADKPYLVLNYAYVDSASVLTMEPGVKVHFHRDAILYVDGSLQVNGTVDEPVWFGGDRLEQFYEHFPGQWGLIYLTQNSRNNRISYAEITNGTFGILISAPPGSGLMPDLEISNTIINHMSANGIYALNAAIAGTNLVIGNCGGSSLGLVYGGDYAFTHCTFANYWYSWYSNRKLPALLLIDYFITDDDRDGVFELHSGGEFDRAEFNNSIIYGNEHSELAIESYEGLQLNYRFDHCLIRVNEDSLDYRNDPLFTSIISNEEPLFDSIPYSFQLDSLSPAIDAGLPAHAVEVPFDLEGNSRLEDSAPDLGAYEWTGG